MDLNSFGFELTWHVTEGRWGVLGSAQPKHITHLPYEITTLTCPNPHTYYMIPPLRTLICTYLCNVTKKEKNLLF